MKINSRASAPRNVRNQQGVALIVGLLMLIIMTIIGLAGVRLLSSQERMVGFAYDRSIAFQAVETTLRTAEALIEANSQPAPAPLAACTDMGISAKKIKVCGAPAASAKPRWLDPNFNDWANAAEITYSSNSIKVKPQYFVEYLGNNHPCKLKPETTGNTCRRYRVTARSGADSERANVVLQTIYATN